MEDKVLKDCFTAAWDQLSEGLKGLFISKKMHHTALSYIRGLLSRTERKNCWQLAEEAGLSDPYAFQHLLHRARFDKDQLRDHVRRMTVDVLGAHQSVLSVDETGFLKKGNQSAGVSRQYSGTAGRIENCQIGVFLSYASPLGRALIDRELYLPKSWTEDAGRCQKAGVDEGRRFKTKPELAQEMLQRAFEGGVKADWVLGDEVYGCFALRQWLEDQEQAYIMAVPCNASVTIGMSQYRANKLIKTFCKEDWQTLSCGQGSKGERYYQWQRIQINALLGEGKIRYLLVRRSCSNSEDYATYIACCDEGKTLQAMAVAAGSRWSIEECFEMAKGETGLDHYEVRSFEGWYRHMTFTMMALSFLVHLRVNLKVNDIPLNVAYQKKDQQTSSLEAFLRRQGRALSP